MEYLKYVKRKNYFNDTCIFIYMILFSLIQRLLIDVVKDGMLIAIITEVIMLFLIYLRINNIMKINSALKRGQLVYGLYDKEYMMALPYAGRGSAGGNFRFGFNHNGEIYVGWIELVGTEMMTEFITRVKEAKMPILISKQGYYVLLNEFAIVEGIVPEKKNEKWVGNLVFGTIRYFVLFMSNLKAAFILESVLLGCVLLIVIYIKYIRPRF